MLVITHMTHSHIHNGNVTLAVSASGEGQQLVFFNGLGATQPFWNKVIRALKGQYQVVTFDFRGHGKSSVATDYSFTSFLSDVEAVIGEAGKDRPLLVGHSLGADLAVWYAATHPGQVAGMFLIDGALPAHLVDDPDEVRRRLSTPLARFIFGLVGIAKSFGIGYRLSLEELTTIPLELDERRQQILEAYGKLDCSVELALALRARGKGLRAEKVSARWHSGGELLASTYPNLPLLWLDSTHLLPLTKPAEIASSLEAFAQRVKTGDAVVIPHSI